LYAKLPEQQLGIGYYESVSATPEAPAPAEQPLKSPAGGAIVPQVVSAPEPGSAIVASERAPALAALWIVASAAAAIWAGATLVRKMRARP